VFSKHLSHGIVGQGAEEALASSHPSPGSPGEPG